MPTPQQIAAKKFCVECGKEMNLNAKGEWFCPQCGFKMTPTPQLAADQKKTSATVLKVILYIAGGAFAIFAVWYFFTKYKEMLSLF